MRVYVLLYTKYGSIFEDEIRNFHPTGTYNFAALDCCTIHGRITRHIFIYIYIGVLHTHTRIYTIYFV